MVEGGRKPGRFKRKVAAVATGVALASGAGGIAACSSGAPDFVRPSSSSASSQASPEKSVTPRATAPDVTIDCTDTHGLREEAHQLPSVSRGETIFVNLDSQHGALALSGSNADQAGASIHFSTQAGLDGVTNPTRNKNTATMVVSEGSPFTVTVPPGEERDVPYIVCTNIYQLQPAARSRRLDLQQQHGFPYVDAQTIGFNGQRDTGDGKNQIYGPNDK